jgi:hypothetical protein
MQRPSTGPWFLCICYQLTPIPNYTVNLFSEFAKGRKRAARNRKKFNNFQRNVYLLAGTGAFRTRRNWNSSRTGRQFIEYRLIYHEVLETICTSTSFILIERSREIHCAGMPSAESFMHITCAICETQLFCCPLEFLCTSRYDIQEK